MVNFTKTKLENTDYILVFLALACTVFGCVAISSAVKTYDGGFKFVLIQSVAALLGFFVAALIASFNFEKLSYYTKFIYMICILFLISVLILGTGRESTGSRSWIRFGPIGIQPSEIVKIGFIITFSKLCENYSEEINKPKNVLKLLIHSSIILGLIMLQPDFGTTMVFIVIIAGILFTAGISYKYIISAIGLIAASVPLVWHFFLKEYQKNRIRVLLNPESDPLGTGYHVMQSKIAIGSGGITGKGFGQGTQTQLGFLPVKHTDFIYSVIGEEFGIVGSVLVALLLFGLVIRCIYVARHANSKFGSYICIGVACMFLAHIFENIGMCIGLMPVTGIPLPFFSYGGSSMIANMMAIGLVESVAIRKNEIKFNNE